ncbi:MAG: DUF2795 domain-containing protein [Actinomycetota bacterium]|nr:DUF2795 domain-containing protein [Actinomycetota bacterium]
MPEKPENPFQEEVAVDFDPEDAREYLKGVDYPAIKEELAIAAESNGAPDDLVRTI